MSAERSDRQVWWFNCGDEECGATMLIYPHPDKQGDLPDESDWETSPSFISCPVCDERMEWGGTDHPSDLLKNYS